MDCFTQNWKNDNNWLVPPINSVNKAVFHLLSCKARGTLIVPNWPSSAFWPSLFKNNLVKQDYILEVLEFPQGQDIFNKKYLEKRYSAV